MLSLQTGDLEKAKQYLEESLRIKRAVHGGRDHPDVGATLGMLSLQTGDLEKAKQYLGGVFENKARSAWRQRSSWCWCHVALGTLSQETGELEKAEQYLEEASSSPHT